VNESFGVPPPTDPLLTGLFGTPEPPPPLRPRGSRLLRTLARVVLWSLIAVGALRGLIPNPVADPDPVAAATPTGDRRAEAVAAAFLREYLTVGGDRAARVSRLGRFTVEGLDLRRSVSMPAGTVQYADHVVASDSRPAGAGIEVTVLAHVLQIRSGTYRDGGNLAFAVPVVVGREGLAVSGRPRPTTLPVVPGLELARPPPAPAAALRAASHAARQAVAAFVDADSAALARLGGGTPPSTRQLPSGWRAIGVGAVEVTGSSGAPTAGVAGSPGALTAQVSVRARPPTGRTSYVVPVRVHLETGPRGVTVLEIDAGGPA
jgi:hypothetical protein